jgi:hypothetical protein
MPDPAEPLSAALADRYRVERHQDERLGRLSANGRQLIADSR